MNFPSMIFFSDFSILQSEQIQDRVAKTVLEDQRPNSASSGTKVIAKLLFFFGSHFQTQKRKMMLLCQFR